MTQKTIKVIKRNERNRAEKPVEEVQSDKKSKQESAREMVATVSQWVNEFQQKRRAETARAIKTLFPETNPQPEKA